MRPLAAARSAHPLTLMLGDQHGHHRWFLDMVTRRIADGHPPAPGEDVAARTVRRPASMKGRQAPSSAANGRESEHVSIGFAVVPVLESADIEVQRQADHGPLGRSGDEAAAPVGLG